ncbi:MAG: hypothetical protein DRP56_11095 [Planctomycetota bacterium]|nr:MAG: hypothetical protein DRP56_11095 [Planctomycetota bacterium]
MSAMANSPMTSSIHLGGYGVMKIHNLQTLMQYICRAGFEHHVAVNICQKSDALAEALDNYMGWEVYRHI